MKLKFLSLTLLFCGAVAVQSRNLLVNGGFDEYNGTFTYNSQNYNCPVYIPGWDKGVTYLYTGQQLEGDFNNDGLNMWNVRAVIYDNDLSEEWMWDENNAFYVRLQRFENDGWYDGGLYQTVDLALGQTYDLSFYYRANEGTTGGEPAVFYVRFRAYNDNLESTNEIEKGSILKEEILPATQEWTYKEFKNLDFESFEKVVLFLGINNVGWGAKNSENVYIEFDEVKLVERSSGLSKLNLSGISVKKSGTQLVIGGLTAGSEIELYDITGKKVAATKALSETCNLPVAGYSKGVYLLKAGRQTLKVIL